MELNKKKKKKKKKSYRYRFKKAIIYKYKDKETLLKYLKENVAKGEIVGSTGNVIMKTAGFAIYKGVSTHLLEEELSQKEMGQFMEEVDRTIIKEQKKRMGKKLEGTPEPGEQIEVKSE